MESVEGIGAGVGAETSRDFLLDLEFSDSSLRAVVVRRYGRILKEVEDVVPAFYDSPFQLIELFSQIVKITFEQVIKSDEPALFGDYIGGLFVSQMYGFAQQCLNLLCPCLLLVNVVEIFQISKKMGKAYLIVEEANCEVCAVAVGHGNHILQRVAKTLFKHFGSPARASEHECQIRCLRNP